MRVPVLLTVPQLTSTTSPYREMMAIAKYLSRQDFELTICSLRDIGYAEAAPELRELGVRCFVAPFRPAGRSIRHFAASLRQQAVIDRFGPFRIQHSLDFTSLPFEAVMARARSRTYIYTQRNMNEKGHPNLLKAKIRLSASIIAPSDATQELLLTLGAPPDKVRRVHRGIDTEEIDSQLPAPIRRQPGRVLAVGHIQKRKRHEDAIRAVALVARDFPHVRLWIAGCVVDPDYYEDLQRLTQNLGLDDKVEFLGLRNDVLALMGSAEVLLHCAESEAFGWVVAEAMAAGLPVIASAVDGPKENIVSGRTGFLAPKGDVAAYATALRTILQQPELARRMAREARSRVEEKLSVKTMAAEIAGLYRELASPNGH